MKKITLTLLALVCALCCAFGLVACNDGETPDDTENGGTQTVAVTGVTLSENELTLEIGDEETLTATIAPDNATNKTVTWSSSAPTIASVDSTGKVTAKAKGTATITATTANNKTATCDVKVNAPAPFTITGSFYMVVQSSTGWVPEQSLGLVFDNDGTCNLNNEDEGTYELDNGVIVMIITGETYYVVLDGNILWLFGSMEDIDDINNAIQPFYKGTEISSEDLAKMVTVFGDGIINADKLSIVGTFYMIGRSNGLFVPVQAVSWVFKDDGTCNLSGTEGTYEIDNGLITATFGSGNNYAVLDGNILWLYMSIEDVDNNSKPENCFYKGTEIGDEDQAKLAAVFKAD